MVRFLFLITGFCTTYTFGVNTTCCTTAVTGCTTEVGDCTAGVTGCITGVAGCITGDGGCTAGGMAFQLILILNGNTFSLVEEVFATILNIDVPERALFEDYVLISYYV